MTSKIIKGFTKGIHNTYAKEIIPNDSFSMISGWLVKNGALELARGRSSLGTSNEGKTIALHTGYKVNGTGVIFKRSGTTVSYWTGSAWTNVITGLVENSPTILCNYQSLAGSFVYIFSTDGIYKICVANPGDYTSLYDASKNFKGLGFIDKGRTIFWGHSKDTTGLYGSYIDTQTAVSGGTGSYTTVSGEATTSLSGTLAFKAGGATRTCFGIQLTITSTGEVYSDDFSGVLTGSLGGTGTINYTTGAYTVSNAGVGTVNYQWEDSNVRGVTDFTKSATRLAGEGFVFRQDYGGDPIKTVLPLEGSYYSIKARNVYKLALDPADETATNEVFRANIGIESRGAATATSKGLILLDTANGDEPIMRIITRNPTGDNFDMVQLFPQFKFSDYVYDDAQMFTYGDYALLACKTKAADANDTLIICDFNNDIVTTVPYSAASFTQLDSVLYTGDSLSQNVYKTFDGFDDLDFEIENKAVMKNDNYDVQWLKKTKKLRLTGLISKGLKISVYISIDNNLPTLVGTIDGTGSYVDMTSPNTVGSTLIGSDVVGGSNSLTVYPYVREIKLNLGKFSRREISFVASGVGHGTIQSVVDYDIWEYEGKLPKKYRLQQKVSTTDSTVTNLSTLGSSEMGSDELGI